MLNHLDILKIFGQYWNRLNSIQIVRTVLKLSGKYSNYPGNIWTVQKVLLLSGQYWTCVEIPYIRNESLNMWDKGGILPPKEKRKSLLCQTFISKISTWNKKTKEKMKTFMRSTFFKILKRCFIFWYVFFKSRRGFSVFELHAVWSTWDSMDFN